MKVQTKKPKVQYYKMDAWNQKETESPKLEAESQELENESLVLETVSTE